MNKIIKFLMISDIFVITGFGLIDPILAIFIKDNLVGGTIFAAGFASALFLMTKCIIQLPFSRYVDKYDDKMRWLIVGTFLIAVVPFIYVFSTSINHIYIAQIFHGAASGLAFPTWLGLWSAHLDKKHQSFEWSLYSTLVGIGTAGTAAIGAFVAQSIGFIYTFVLVGVMSLIGCGILLWLQKSHSGCIKRSVRRTRRK